jgi:D-xylose transport system permease protein
LLLLNVAIPVVGIVAFIWVMNAYQGVPIPVLIFVSVALIGVFLTTSTVLAGICTRSAAILTQHGFRDKQQTKHFEGLRASWRVHRNCGVNIHCPCRQCRPDAGTLKELDAIAACVIGGASLMGGRGTVFGACIGALIMASLDNGMSLLNVRDFMQDIVKGSILVAAVGLDMMGRKQT